MKVGAPDRTAVVAVQNEQRPSAEVASNNDYTVAVEPIRFTNPMIRVDQSGLVIVQFRDSRTGEVELQIPAKLATEKYQEEVRQNERRVQQRSSDEGPPATEASAGDNAETMAASPGSAKPDRRTSLLA